MIHTRARARTHTHTHTHTLNSCIPLPVMRPTLHKVDETFSHVICDLPLVHLPTFSSVTSTNQFLSQTFSQFHIRVRLFKWGFVFTNGGFVFTNEGSSLPMGVRLYQWGFVFINEGSSLPMGVCLYQWRFVFTDGVRQSLFLFVQVILINISSMVVHERRTPSAYATEHND